MAKPVQYIVWVEIECYDEDRIESGYESRDVDFGQARAATFSTEQNAVSFATTLQQMAREMIERGDWS